MSFFRKRILYQAIVLIIGVIAYYYVINRLFAFNGWADFVNLIQGRLTTFWFIFAIQIFLLAINFITETVKWHILISGVHLQSFTKSLKQVLSGYSVGTFTPARLGEPVGRLIDLPKSGRVSAIGLTFVGGMVHNVVIVVFGIIAIIIQLNFFDQQVDLFAKMGTGLVYLMTLGVIVFAAGLVFLKFLLPLKYKEWRRMFVQQLTSLSAYNWSRIIGLTVSRYLIFSTQLFIWLIYFNGSSDYWVLIFLIPVYYLILTVVPSFILTELGVRGSVAILIFGSISTNNIGLITAVFLVWIINVGTPTLLGATIHLRHKQNFRMTK